MNRTVSGHASYFQGLQDALRETGITTPTLVIDLERLNQNIDILTKELRGRFDFRLVVKSLPSLSLLDQVMKRASTNRLMVFHQPFLNQVAAEYPNCDILLGKPMPVAAANEFYTSLSPNSFDPSEQLQWLVDTPQRLMQYLDLAETQSRKMKVNIEIDVGLHRGGVSDDQDLAHMLRVIDTSSNLEFSGFMGYEPHIAKMPFGKLGYRDKAMAVYEKRVKQAESILQRSIKDLTLNSGGSPTYRLYNKGEFPMNELSAGSCLVKPIDFDTVELDVHTPAAYIAAPVLKVAKKLQIPGLQIIGDAMALFNRNRRKSIYTYGGYWMASPVSPEGLQTNPIIGRSTNQEMLNCSEEIEIQPDDFIFLRPHQSEFVFLQFGSIAIFDGQNIINRWPVLHNP